MKHTYGYCKQHIYQIIKKMVLGGCCMMAIYWVENCDFYSILSRNIIMIVYSLPHEALVVLRGDICHKTKMIPLPQNITVQTSIIRIPL